MNNILFITASDFSQRIDNGGVFVSKKNLDLLRRIPDCQVVALALSHKPELDNSLNIKYLPISSNKLHKLFIWLSGYAVPFNRKNEKIVLKYLGNKKYTTLFIDSSVLGILAMRVKAKFPDVKIVSYFHNLEYVLSWSKYRSNITNIFNLIRFLTISSNEKRATKYSDICIAINDRDKAQIENKYNIAIPCVIPVLFDDYTLPDKTVAISKPLEVLFVGAWFWPNVHGIRWFIDHVLPSTHIKLTVVGRGMEKLRENYSESDKLKILGTVQDIEAMYNNADCFISPIFYGSGMKIKTGEALLHGKTVLGTHEAFTGYSITNGIEGYICETAGEYLKAFNTIAEKQETKVNYASNLFIKNNLSKKAFINKLAALL